MRIEHDIFDLIGGGSKYHSAIVTCYSFDPVFFSNLYLPNLRSAGPRNIIVLVDASNYDSALDGFEKYGNMVPDMKCHLVRMEPTSNGVFHPKMSSGELSRLVGKHRPTMQSYGRYGDTFWGCCPRTMLSTDK